MLKFLVILTLLASAGSVFAVEADRWTPDEPDVLNLKFGFLSPSFRMSTKSTIGDGKGSEVEFAPPPLTKLFVGVGYRNLGAAVSWSGGQDKGSSSMYGSGSGLDLLLTAYGRTLTQQYFYQAYSGYYVSNTQAVEPTTPIGSYIQRPDLSTTHYGANFIYNFQPERYSRAVAFDQSGHQFQEGGAWLAMLGVHNHTFSSNPQLLPSQVSAKYGELATLQKGDIMQVNLSGGGGYTWAFETRYTLSAELLIGVGVAQENFETAEYVYRKSAFNINSNVNFSVGYNGIDNYWIVQAGADAYTYELPDLSLRMSSDRTSFHYGHRFREINAPLLNTLSNWLD